MSINIKEEKIGEIRFPAEFEPHHGTLLIWPERPGSWGKDTSGAEKAYINIIKNLIQVEDVYLLVSKASFEAISTKLRDIFSDDYDNTERLSNDHDNTECLSNDHSISESSSDKKSVDDHSTNTSKSVSYKIGKFNLHIIEMETDDSWARDTGPTFVFNKTGDVLSRIGINWTFNAWGGEYDGLYASWDKDDKVAKNFTNYLGDKILDAGSFVLEGGSIHTDGERTLMVTESCLLSKGRNPSLTKTEIENTLKKFLGVEKVLWLPFGIYNDETNEHVDNVAAFIKPGEIVLAWTDNESDPQYNMSKADYDYLSSETDAKGQKLTIHKIPVPDIPVRCTEADIDNYIFEPGEDEREAGERLAASYVNFYFANGCILLPQFGGENEESDKRAQAIFEKICSDKKIIPINTRSILLGGGNIHCITQQIPYI